MFQHTAARRRLGKPKIPHPPNTTVSTHSRPKAAGAICCDSSEYFPCFNTQPPEGGWYFILGNRFFFMCFNTQPPEGGWYLFIRRSFNTLLFQHTAARRRLVEFNPRLKTDFPVSTHSRPKAAGIELTSQDFSVNVSTHSRPKAAGG